MKILDISAVLNALVTFQCSLVLTARFTIFPGIMGCNVLYIYFNFFKIYTYFYIYNRYVYMCVVKKIRIKMNRLENGTHLRNLERKTSISLLVGGK